MADGGGVEIGRTFESENDSLNTFKGYNNYFCIEFNGKVLHSVKTKSQHLKKLNELVDKYNLTEIKQKNSEFDDGGAVSDEIIIKSGNNGNLKVIYHAIKNQRTELNANEVFEQEKIKGKSVFLFVNDELYDEFIADGDENKYADGGMVNKIIGIAKTHPYSNFQETYAYPTSEKVPPKFFNDLGITLENQDDYVLVLEIQFDTKKIILQGYYGTDGENYDGAYSYQPNQLSDEFQKWLVNSLLKEIKRIKDSIRLDKIDGLIKELEKKSGKTKKECQEIIEKFKQIEETKFNNGGGVENAEMPTRERTTITKPTTTPTTTPSKPDKDNPYKPKIKTRPKASKYDFILINK